MAGHHRLQPVDQLVERREAAGVRPARQARRPEVPVRMLVQLLPSLVGRVERPEERDRVGDMDGDRQTELAGRGPERIEAGVLDRDEPAGRVARPEPEQLPDLQPAGAVAGRRAEPAGLLLAEVPALRPHAVVEAGEDGHPSTERRPPRHLAAQRLALAAVEVDDGRDPRRLQGRSRARPASRLAHSPENGVGPEVVVGVDGREGGARRGAGPADAQLGARPVVDEPEVVGRRPGRRRHGCLV